MQLLGSNCNSLGLDIGASGIKSVLLKKNGKNPPQIASTFFYDVTEEGILNDAELYESIHQWLVEQKLIGCKTAVSIPQYLATTVTKEFPTNDKNELEKLVSYETKQVAGLSEEALLNDYCPLPPGLGRKHPVIIGMCREQLSNEKYRICETAGIRVEALGLGGIAIVNAFFALFPEAAKESSPVLLLDLGKENSTAVVLASGQPLFTGSLMFSGEKFAQACQEQGKGEKGKLSLSAPKNVTQADLREEVGHSPLLLAAKLLENEIQGAVETWRSQEEGNLAQTPVAKVYITGGVARLKGLREWLEERLETPVEMFGPFWEGECQPEQTLAYGLALQAADVAAIPLSLLSEEVHYMRQREKNWPYLAVAVAVIALIGFFLESFAYCRVGERLESETLELEELQRCGELIGRITSAQETLNSREAKLIPLVVAGNQSKRIVDTLSVLGKVRDGKNWYFYIGDERCYGNIISAPTPSVPVASSMFVGDNRSSGANEFPIRLLPYETPIMEACIVGCCISTEFDANAVVKELQKKLDSQLLFQGVDSFPEKSDSRGNGMFRRWRDFLNKVPTLPKNSYRSFILRMPYDKQVVNCKVAREVAEARAAKGKKKKK